MRAHQAVAGIDSMANGVGSFVAAPLVGSTSPTAGSSHTLLVTPRSTGLAIKYDANAAVSWTLSSTILAAVGDATKHGIFASSTSATFSAFSVS